MEWTPEMEAQYREYRRGGAAGPPHKRDLWAPQFEARLKEDLNRPAKPRAPQGKPQYNWPLEMETQYREWRRGGAAGPPHKRDLWAPQFEARLKDELNRSRWI